MVNSIFYWVSLKRNLDSNYIGTVRFFQPLYQQIVNMKIYRGIYIHIRHTYKGLKGPRDMLLTLGNVINHKEGNKQSIWCFCNTCSFLTCSWNKQTQRQKLLDCKTSVPQMQQQTFASPQSCFLPAISISSDFSLFPVIRFKLQNWFCFFKTKKQNFAQ